MGERAAGGEPAGNARRDTVTSRRLSSVWLVGLSGAGKSTVGPLLARELDWRFVDLDRMIETAAAARAGEIFRIEGEAGFRRREVETTRRLAVERGLVVATGGGWAANPEAARIPEGCVRVWLRVAPETAAARLRRGSGTRPLLEGRDPADILAELLVRRERSYARAEIAVDTDGRSPEQVVAAVMERLATGGVRMAGGRDDRPDPGAAATGENADRENREPT